MMELAKTRSVILFIYFKTLLWLSEGQEEHDHSYENSMILTTVPKISWWSDSHHIYILPGTPYDFSRNQSYYSPHFHLKKSNQLDAKLKGCKVDYSRKVFYMYDESAARIEAIQNFDWSNHFASVTSVDRLHVGVSVGYVKLAIDWVSHNIYWTDPLYRWIGMQSGDPVNIDRSMYKIIVKEELEKPYGLAVDPLGGFIFWTDISKYPKIERATLTGANRETIISSGLLFPLCIEVDYTGSNRRIYWADVSRDTVESATLGGEDRRIIKRVSHTEFYDIALFRDVLSVVDVRGNKVFFINKHTGQEIADPYQRQMEVIWGMCMYDDETQPQRTDYCSSAGCSDLCVNEGGKASCLCRDGYELNSDGMTCREDTSKYHRAIVLADSHSIYLADVRCLTAVFSTYQHTQIYSTSQTIMFIAVDMVDRKIFFATDTDISYVVIDMVSPREVHVVTSQYRITGLSLDWSRNSKNVYWTSTSGMSTGRINVVSYNGGGSYTLKSGLDNPRGLKILALEEKMVWVSGGINNSTIEISDLDGTNRKTVVPSYQLYKPQSLEFDSHTNKLYWVDNGSIKVVNIDGSGLDVLSVSASTPNLFLIYKDYLVWTEDSLYESTIKSANAVNPKQAIYSDSFVGVGIVVAFSMLDESLQPDTKGPCEADNGECEHICIPVGRIAICKCEYGFTIDSNGRTCSSEPLLDNFLVVTDWSHNKIYQVSLVDDDDVRAIDIKTAGNPNAVIFDSINKRVIWGDTKDKSVWSAYLNGSDHKRLFYYGSGNSFADRFAIDTTSGNLYYTSVDVSKNESGFKGVSVISQTGYNKHLVSDVDTPRDVVVDPVDGLMFWTDHGTIPSVKRANMDGSSAVVIVSSNIEWPNGIAIDYQAKKLYLTDGHYNTIQKCSYSGSCIMIHSDADAHLMDIELSGQYLYYTAWNRPYITRLNKDNPNDVTRLATNAELGRLDSISVYRSSATSQPVNSACLPNEGFGDCSTLCLPTTSGRTCACQNGISLWPGSNICNDFPKCSSSVPHGQITGVCSYLHLSSCSYTCDTFYVPATTNSRISCSNGEWSNKNPCLFSATKCPSTILNGTFESSCTYNNSETCRYNCNHGYEPTVAGSSLTCTLGSWNNNKPCEKIEPDCPTEVDHVIFSNLCLYQNGEQCSISCAAGFFSQSRNLICSNNVWNVNNPCQEIKCPSHVDKVIFGSCSYTNGSTCPYSCSMGYRPTSSSSSMTCLNGVWGNANPCAEFKCPANVTRVSFAPGCQYTHGSSCSYTCQDGYTPTMSDRTLTCNDGSWNTQNPCKVLKCSSNIPHGSITAPCSYNHLASCAFTCDRFYEPATNNSSIVCTNGEWNFESPCVFSDKKCPSLENVNFETSCNYNNGATCRYSCDHGYTPSVSSVTCNLGTWDNQRPCLEIVPDCPTEVGQVVFSGQCLYQNNERCSYSCKDGYSTTSSSMVCVDGVWNVNKPCEEIKCPLNVDKVIFEGYCPYTNGSTCSYRCSPGYRPTSTDNSMTCLKGLWSSNNPCKEFKCPANVTRVSFAPGCQYTHGSSCSYTCQGGYTPTMSGALLTCNDGSWNTQTPCRILKCPSTISYGQITEPCSYSHQTSCSYTCNTFYQPATSNRSISCTNGEWNVKNPCVFSATKCPSTILNGTFESSCTYNNSETCRYNCNHGYEPTVAGSSLTCTLGSWNNNKPCEKIEPDCPTEVDHVIFSNLCLYQNGEQCSISCAAGFFSQSRNLICSNNVWNVNNPCQEIKCPSHVDKVIFGSCSYTNGSTCPYSCSMGYRPTSSSSSMTCLNGVWGNANPCAEFKCPANVTRVSFAPGCQYTHGSSCSYTCQDGYTPTMSDRTLTCNDGSWNTQNPCKVLKCSSNIPHGSITAPCSYNHLASCAFTCDRFYEPATNNSSIVCTNGEWNFESPCVFSDKKCPSLENVNFETSCNYNNGATCRYSCDHGYTPSVSSVTCNLGTWDNQRPCLEIVPDCPTEVGQVVFSGQCLYQNNERCSYSCKDGYSTTSSSMVCVDGVWNVNKPCEEIKCPLNVDKVIFEGYCPYTNGSTCSYRCSPGYRPTSTDNSMTCLKGLWSSNNPCKEFKCPANVTRVSFAPGCQYTHGSSCSYTCQGGYTPTMSGALLTCNDGSWNTQTPCRILKCPSTISYGQITEPCSYSHQTSCSYTCNTFYQPATSNRSISCTNGEWNVKNPCVFSDDKCPPMDYVEFDSSCQYNNGETCRYSCHHGYTPTVSGSSLTCHLGTWNIQNPCQKIEPDCPTEVDHVKFSELCLYQNSEQCSYTCEDGYLRTAGNMICLHGAWNVRNPCDEIKCPKSVNKVIFNGSCLYTNASTCPYSCIPGYRPTSSTGSMTCIHGVWDNTSPCREFKCPAAVSGVKFSSGCSYSHGSACSFSCEDGYTPTVSSRQLSCNDGSWDNQTPCKITTTTSTITTPPPTSPPETTAKSSSISLPFSHISSSTEAAAPPVTEAQSASIVPVAAGAGVGSLVLVAIIVAVVCFVCKRTQHRKNTERDTLFESPCYQGFDNLAAVGALSSPFPETLRPDSTYDRADRPDSTYDKADNRDSTYASIDDMGLMGCSETECPEPDYPGRHMNEYTNMARRKGVAPLSGEYESLHRDESDYLEPTKSVRSKPIQSDYLEPTKLNPYQENFM